MVSRHHENSVYKTAITLLQCLRDFHQDPSHRLICTIAMVENHDNCGNFNPGQIFQCLHVILRSKSMGNFQRGKNDCAQFQAKC